jgi:hypothetical protein
VASGQFGAAGAAWEQFAYGFSVGGQDGTAIGSTVLSDIADDVAAFHATQGAHIGFLARLTKIKIALVSADGTWVTGKAVYERTLDVPGGGGGSAQAGPQHAPQVALAVTFRTSVNKARNRGRFYLPLPTTPVGPDGLISESNAAQVAQTVAELVQSVDNQPGFDQNTDGVVVASTFGPLSKVTSISCGRVLDTIRSRRTDIPERYMSVPVPA